MSRSCGSGHDAEVSRFCRDGVLFLHICRIPAIVGLVAAARVRYPCLGMCGTGAPTGTAHLSPPAGRGRPRLRGRVRGSVQQALRVGSARPRAARRSATASVRHSPSRRTGANAATTIRSSNKRDVQEDGRGPRKPDRQAASMFERCRSARPCSRDSMPTRPASCILWRCCETAPANPLGYPTRLLRYLILFTHDAYPHTFDDSQCIHPSITIRSELRRDQVF
jgi:hypothetical protein